MKEKSNVEMDGFITAEEYREREARKVNLIMHRVRESEAVSAELRREADTLECGKIFRAAGVSEQDSEIKACRRLGEKGNDPRPLVKGNEEGDGQSGHLGRSQAAEEHRL
jgi:hypothetical protein